MVLGNIPDCKTFAWMYPHLRCQLLDYIKTYKVHLTEYLIKVYDYKDPIQASKLLKSVKWDNNDIGFLMNCSMIYRLPVVVDPREDSNLDYASS